jgi:hypothetical protein
MADEEQPKDKQPNVATEEADPKAKAEKKASKKGGSRWQRFISWYKDDKRKSIPLTVVVLLLLLAAWPFSRYHAAGLVMKKDFTLQINDAATKTPVSGADVQLGAAEGQTNANGKVTLHHVAVGRYTAVITKKYYDDSRVSVVIPIMQQKNVPQVAFTARGRQVKISLTNAINGNRLVGAEIKASGTTATTDNSGSATIVVPTGVNSLKATLSAKDFNDTEVTVLASDKEVKDNNFKLTPAGEVYFLSKLSGKIDVVKTNLDGTKRATVLAGTGSEEDQGTVLLASRDWKYLALLSKRDKGNPKLYLISTADDSLSVMDQGNASFSPVGWNDDNFVYVVTRNDKTDWQAGKQAIKSYDGQSKQTTTLDQTRASGTSAYDFISEEYGTIFGLQNPSVYEIGKNIIYDKSWNSGYTADASQLTTKNDTIYSISATGTNPVALKTFAAGSVYTSSIPYESDEIYYRIFTNGGGSTAYYSYKNGKITASNDASSTFDQYLRNRDFPTYLLSPSGNNTFWSDERDGKKILFVGDNDGENGKQVAPLSEYQTYGWFSDDYLLVSKNSSELYILPRDGIKKDSDAIKISDYHKPAKSFFGYGGGYGGI